MDFSAIFETVKGVVEAIIESGLIDKLVAVAEKTVPAVIEVITSLAGAIAG